MTRRTVVVAASLIAAATGTFAPAAFQQPPSSLQALAADALSQIGGTLQAGGLQKEVEIIRDRWGVPHLYAASTEDLYFAQGYVAAQDRLWQMEMWRRSAEGRLPKCWGRARSRATATLAS